uniref:Lipase n=1 Tax=Megaselia scalaris TaxID=36166 RepID=T1GBG6_MEGSC
MLDGIRNSSHRRNMKSSVIIFLGSFSIAYSAFTPDRIEKYGYPSETHQVETEDGYILQNSKTNSTKPPVLVVHGIIGSSDHYVITGPKQGLVFQLYDQGYDVWLANTRGNTYTKKHKSLSTSSQEFWNYTFHELAIYDLPATIDHVLETTKKDKIHYIGHSQGTTVFFVLLSERPEYNKIIQSAVLLAPVAFMGSLREPHYSEYFRFVAFTFLAPELGRKNPEFDKMGSFEVFPFNKRIAKFATDLCMNNGELCKQLFKYGGSTGYKHYQQRLIPDIFATFPCSSSVNQFVHYGQMFMSNKFQKCDWGSKSRNMMKYGSPSPPEYNLENVKVPVNLIYSDDDAVVSPTDVKRLLKRLPNVKSVKFIQNEGWQHFDFLWSLHVKSL